MDSQETKIFISIIIIVVVLSIVILMFTTTYVKQQRKNRKLQEEKLSAEIRTLENERERIAKDMHDDFGPTLSAIKMKLNSLQVAEAAGVQIIKDISGNVDMLMQQVRAISNDLLPYSLQKGFGEAIKQYASKLTASTTIGIEIKLFSNAEISIDKRIHLFRIAQEIIHNAVKHSQAKLITILLKENSTQHFLEIRDDGIGFDEEQINKDKGLGLNNIKSRVEHLKGRLQVHTKKNEGTGYTIVIEK